MAGCSLMSSVERLAKPASTSDEATMRVGPVGLAAAAPQTRPEQCLPPRPIEDCQFIAWHHKYLPC
eukprot:1569465-Prymnesium_polylepis.1